MSKSPQLLVLGAIEEALHILTRPRHFLAGVLLLVFATSALAEVCPNPQVPKAERKQADQLLVLSETEQAGAIQVHLPFGTPECPKLLPEREYILCYDPVLRIGLWAGYRLRAEDVIPAKRRNAFRTDPRLTDQETAHCADMGPGRPKPWSDKAGDHEERQTPGGTPERRLV
jgi:DNA/RNA endonuclease G (NUC1)